MTEITPARYAQMLLEEVNLTKADRLVGNLIYGTAYDKAFVADVLINLLAQNIQVSYRVQSKLTNAINELWINRGEDE